MKTTISLAAILAMFIIASASAQNATPPTTAPACVPRAVSAPQPAAAAEATPTAIVESRIDGDFDGWDGETVFRLENGHVWQQNAKGAKYHFATRPAVRISGTPAMLHVEGFAPSIEVRRIK
jgi:hypothetical protein